MIRVIKLGGRLQGDPTVPQALAQAVADVSAGQVVIVHGGGDDVSALQRQLGQEPRFVGGRRVTTAAELDVVRMVLSGVVNKRLVRQLLSAGVPAVGISGDDGGLLIADVLDHGALGAVGAPRSADRRVVDALLNAGFIPVVSPLGRDATSGEGLNVNGDDAAAALAVSLAASELLLLADVPGVLDDTGRPLVSLDLERAARLVLDGIAKGGMSAKLDAARRALTGGVTRVRIGNAGALRDSSAGTTITLSPSVV